MNCLIIKLNESVQGTGFDYFDALKITYNYDDIAKNSAYVKKDTHITTYDGEIYTSDGFNLINVGTNYTTSEDKYLFFKPNSYYYIHNASKLKDVQGGIIKADEFNAFNAVHTSFVCDGELKVIKFNEKIGYMHFIYNEFTRLYGDISCLSKYTYLEDLRFATLNGISGNITSLGTLINLMKLTLGDTNISGDLIDFVKEQRKNGRKTCDEIKIYYLLTSKNIIFNGQPITKYDNTTLNLNTLSWTETTITLGDVTINA